jgi:hypothetical protein
VKSLLLLFDEIAILLPSYMRGRHVVADPTLAAPIEDRGLLRVLEPETFLDDETVARLAAMIDGLIEGGAFDELTEVERFAELSMSRMGFGALYEVADRINNKLNERSLVKASEDSLSIPMHPGVRIAYLLILAQLARDTGVKYGLDLHPVTSRRGVGEAFHRFLELEPMPTRGHVVDFDLQVVAFDLDDVPLVDRRQACLRQFPDFARRVVAVCRHLLIPHRSRFFRIHRLPAVGGSVSEAPHKFARLEDGGSRHAPGRPGLR